MKACVHIYSLCYVEFLLASQQPVVTEVYKYKLPRWKESQIGQRLFVPYLETTAATTDCPLLGQLPSPTIAAHQGGVAMAFQIFSLIGKNGSYKRKYLYSKSGSCCIFSLLCFNFLRLFYMFKVKYTICRQFVGDDILSFCSNFY